MAGRRNKHQERQIAERRIDALFALARSEALGLDADLADAHAGAARRVATRYQIPLGARKAQVCACGAFRVPGRTSRTRVSRGRVVTTCLRCGTVRRRPLGTVAARAAHRGGR